MYISSKDVPEERTQMDPSVLPDSVRYMEEGHRRHIIKLWNSKHSHISHELMLGCHKETRG